MTARERLRAWLASAGDEEAYKAAALIVALVTLVQLTCQAFHT